MTKGGNMKTVILLLSVFLFNTSQANTTSLPPYGTPEERMAMQAAIGARNEFIQALVQRDYVDLARAGFDHAVRDLADQLEQNQDLGSDRIAIAQGLRAEWGDDGGESQFAMALAMGVTMGTLDLGDHAPLFAWLEQKLVQLEDKYGAIITRLPIVQNVRMLNFALPVVFAPASKSWQLVNQDNRIEYRKHFIPFANLVTYYASLYACNAVVIKSQYPQLKRFCKTAAQKLQFAMGRYVAPHISDFVYKVSNRRSANRPQFGREQLRYETSDDLSIELRGGRL
jgi:hypothetical protein